MRDVTVEFDTEATRDRIQGEISAILEDCKSKQLDVMKRILDVALAKLGGNRPAAFGD
jgi:hypothetical protein